MKVFLRFLACSLMLGTLFAVACSNNTDSGLADAGMVVLPDLNTAEGEVDKPFPCGNGTCPNSNYQCCQDNKDAPPECCLKGYNACYKDGGGISGWPVYNGCNPQRCKDPKPKHCKAGTRGTCCRSNEKCGELFGYAFCVDEACPEKNKCNGGKLCCTKPGICAKFKNVEYCDEDCAAQGKEKCEIQGSYYGDQKLHVCCPTGQCRIHPDGWPYCLNDLF
ncbi:MAG: hypothetical protein EP343_10080 [Deltaproteobacteria bacterium]|nr:MAG: hypothetical protein EP343_10080 [Deltaproteobacteria bacterium]